MPTETQVPADHAMMKAWTEYCGTDEYRNTAGWASKGAAYTAGSLWAAFTEGWRMATERAGSLHESVNPASDEERHSNAPGAGAMGAVIQYRDLIRNPTA